MNATNAATKTITARQIVNAIKNRLYVVEYEIINNTYDTAGNFHFHAGADQTIYIRFQSGKEHQLFVFADHIEYGWHKAARTRAGIAELIEKMR